MKAFIGRLICCVAGVLRAVERLPLTSIVWNVLEFDRDGLVDEPVSALSDESESEDRVESPDGEVV